MHKSVFHTSGRGDSLLLPIPIRPCFEATDQPDHAKQRPSDQLDVANAGYRTSVSSIRLGQYHLPLLNCI